MNNRFQFALSAAALLAMTSCAFAQPVPPSPPTPPGVPDMQGKMLGGPMRHDLLFVAGMQLEQERVVQGAPYCADAVHETVQQLADGNRIVQKQSSRQCRDGQGRTRQEVTARNGRVNVFLRDPVAKEAWMLDGDRKLAVRIDAPRQPLAPIEPKMWERMKEWSSEMREHLKEKLHMQPPEAPMALEPVRIAMHPGAVPDILPISLHPRLLGPRGPGSTTLMPNETIEGLRADGKRTVWTIDAGKIGNEKPITITNEVWSSPDLGITLRTRDVDPVTGEASYSVRNVVRGEPDAQLFRVPAEFAKVSPPDLMSRRKP
jgi:hypothetical protein